MFENEPVRIEKKTEDSTNYKRSWKETSEKNRKNFSNRDFSISK